jgi:hypothetical protein
MSAWRPTLARLAEGRPEPASALHSPVARDYPSRVTTGFFMPAPSNLMDSCDV